MISLSVQPNIPAVWELVAAIKAEEQAMKRTWIRRIRDTGEQIEISEQEAKSRLRDSYIDPKLAMDHASKDTPLTNGFSDFWPK